jgi:acetyl-CoA/propionyl-CoA carboxylase biotin carboxyl carrier protein
MVTGSDLVAEQIRVAAGHPLSFTQDSIERRGHSIECRINAEDPARSFQPAPGLITHFDRPDGLGVRTDAGYAAGLAVSQYYDNLMAKLVTWGPDRESARRRMLRALGEFRIEGVPSTIPAHRILLSHPDFVEGRHSTKWLEEDLDPSVFAETGETGRTGGTGGTVAVAGEAAGDGPLVSHTVPVEVDGRRFQVRVWLPEGPAPGEGGGGGSAGAAARPRAGRPRSGSGEGGGAGSATVSAPMQGTIVKTLVAVGDEVQVGQAVVVLEAMKMENHVNAERAGTVAEVRVGPGDTVGMGDVLVVIT